MTGDQLRTLLDVAWDVGARVDNQHVIQWAQLQRLAPLDSGFHVRIAEKFVRSGTLIVPKGLPSYAKEFLQLCEHEKSRLDELGEPTPTLSVIDQRRYIEQLTWFGGLDVRERRYLDQLYGFSPFTSLKQVELATQEHLTPPAIRRRLVTISRKLISAAWLSQLPPTERLQALCR